MFILFVWISTEQKTSDLHPGNRDEALPKPGTNARCKNKINDMHEKEATVENNLQPNNNGHLADEDIGLDDEPELEQGKKIHSACIEIHLNLRFYS